MSSTFFLHRIFSHSVFRLKTSLAPKIIREHPTAGTHQYLFLLSALSQTWPASSTTCLILSNTWILIQRKIYRYRTERLSSLLVVQSFSLSKRNLADNLRNYWTRKSHRPWTCQAQSCSHLLHRPQLSCRVVSSLRGHIYQSFCRNHIHKDGYGVSTIRQGWV